VVYVDNDPVVSVHAEALMAQNHTTAVVRSDLRHADQRHPGIRYDPGTVAVTRRPFSQPVVCTM
jgi:hypothetical protein